MGIHLCPSRRPCGIIFGLFEPKYPFYTPFRGPSGIKSLLSEPARPGRLKTCTWSTKHPLFVDVESEKTAIICSAMMPQYLWLATGGKS